jgi:hypothetical protein
VRIFYASRRPVVTVANEDALRARTPEDLAVAAILDKSYLFPSLLSTGFAGFIVEETEIPPSLPGHPPPPDPWTDRVCRADAVIIGHATSERVLLTHSETFLITVSEVSVDRWLIPKTGAKTLTMATEGGKVKVGERDLTATINGEIRDFRRPWLLTLRKLPGATALVLVLSGSPVPLGTILPAEGVAPGVWKSTEARVARVAATCGDRR